jgi:hypothetical protein
MYHSPGMGRTATRNVTVVLEDEVARWARHEAAEHDTSVSRFLGDLLKDRMLAARGYQRAMREALGEKPLSSNWSGRLPSRDKAHERR